LDIHRLKRAKAPRSSSIYPAKKKVDLRPLKKLNICLWIADLEWQMLV
jgi:hypothetical protein